MARVPVPFQGPILGFHDATSRRFTPGLADSEVRAVLDILTDPDYLILEEAVQGLRETKKVTGRGRAGRNAEHSARHLLAMYTTALVLNLDFETAYARLYSEDQLREHLGLAALTHEERAVLADDMARKAKLPGAPAVTSGSDLTARWLDHDPNRRDTLFAIMRDTFLRVAADVIHRYDLPTGWVAIDGTRVLASTREEKGARADPGAKVHSRTKREDTFNQRHHHVAILANLPLVLDTMIVPPADEGTYWTSAGIPSIANNGRYLGETITQMRIRDGVHPSRAEHRGLFRAAVSSDNALANKEAVETLIAHDFHPAVIRPQLNPEIRGNYTVVRHLVPTKYPIRMDGSVLCPHCTTNPHAPADTDQATVMETLAGEFGKYIRVRCPDPICPSGGQETKIPLRGVDNDDRIPGMHPSRAERNAWHISILPTTSDQYIARRHLASQHVEWTHARFEMYFGLGTKNKGFDRRKISGTDRNRFWWSLASIIWNITIRHNLDAGRAELIQYKERGSNTITFLVESSWSQSATVKAAKESARNTREKKLDEEIRKREQRNARKRKPNARAGQRTKTPA